MLNNKSKRNADFGRLLSGAINSIAMYEGKKAPIIEQEIGEIISLSIASVQRYKAGYLPPDPHTIQIIAEAGVKRGYLDRRWLSRFLRASEFPSPDALIDRLCPQTIMPTENGGRVMENLPAPCYARFVMRDGPFSEIINALQKRTALVVLSSLGGMGKTSLAREVAGRCREHNGNAPYFEGIVWTSDSERPGYTTLSSVLDEIAHTLGYSPFANLPHEEKRREVDQLLRRWRTLVIVDNFETVTDMALLRWLLNLPEPSKAIITTREWRREFRQGACHVELRGMSEAESTDFITQRLAHLHLEQYANDIKLFDPLIEVTGGSPKAIEMSLGCLKYERRPLQEVVDDLYIARGELFEDLIQRSWALLDEAARRVLLSSTLFEGGMNSDALSVTSDVRGQTFTRSIERLDDLAFIDVQPLDLQFHYRYALHPLVRAFARAELLRDPVFEEAARGRWVNWYVNLVSQVGYCRNDLNQLKRLDPEQNMLHVVTEWTRSHNRHSDTFALVNGCAFYCYVRGLLHKEPNLNLAAADAARALNRPVNELTWLSHHVQRTSRAGNISAAQEYLNRMQQLASSIAAPITNDTSETYYHSLATYWLACGDVDKAESAWRQLLHDNTISYSARLITTRWLAYCLQKKGCYAEARELLAAALTDIRPDANQRAVIALHLQMSRLFLDEGNLWDATAFLNKANEQVTRNAVERHIPDVHLLEGLLMKSHDDLAGARDSLHEAMDGFQRLGLSLEVLETRQALESIPIVS